MFSLRKGRYRVRTAQTWDDLKQAQRLRFECFRASCDTPVTSDRRDRDRFDASCLHVLTEDCETGQLVGCFRVLFLASGADISQSYSAQFYNLSALRSFTMPMAEIGRFCIDPDRHDPDILRITWGAVAQLVEKTGVKMLFGCTSFQGTDARDYMDSFAMLRSNHLAPARWKPKLKATDLFRFSQTRCDRPDEKQAVQKMPPLLRTYLGFGGWVSDHAVVDRDLNRLHVFTGLEIRAIPPANARRLSAMATRVAG